MARVRLSLVVGLVAAVATAGHCRATRSWQVTTDGRSMRGVFSPDGDRIAYVQYGPKSFDKAGHYGFETRVRVWSRGGDRVLLRVPPEPRRQGRPTVQLSTRELSARWLPSGRYIAIDDPGTANFWLVAADGSLTTRVGQYRNWYVLNRAVSLGRDDGVVLNNFLRADAIDPMAAPPWLWKGTVPPSPRNAPGLFDIALPHAGTGPGTGNVPARTIQFATWQLTGPRQDGNTVPFPLLRFADHDPEQPMWSPNGRWVTCLRDKAGRIPSSLVSREGFDLWVHRQDGSGAHRIARDVGAGGVWLDNEWVLFIGRHEEGVWQRQYGIANARTSAGQRITAGPYEHWVTDFRHGRFLVEEHPAGEPDSNQYVANLYIIEPLRVRM
jgi:WD40-like Beta Propeller Repeat